MSAMLGYLLDSNKDHGLGDAFVRLFLSALSKERFKGLLDSDFIDVQSSLEEPYIFKGSRRDVDIQLVVVNKKKDECHRLILENKTKLGAAKEKQLKEYYSAVTKEEQGIENLTFVFLTPKSNNHLLQKQFENLELIHDMHAKYWIHWSASDTCIVSMVRELLALESSGLINPINDYIRHTLKAFAVHCDAISDPQKRRIMNAGADLGEIVDETEIQLKSGSYRVVRRDSSQIQVFNLESGDKEVARYILAQYIAENGIALNPSEYNTRTLGRKFFEWRSKN